MSIYYLEKSFEVTFTGVNKIQEISANAHETHESL